MKTIGHRIAAAREKKGLNQSELSRLLGVKPQSVQAWESNKNTPRPKRLGEIAIALGTSVSALVEDFESPSAYSSSPSQYPPKISHDSEQVQNDISISEYDITTHKNSPVDYVSVVNNITIGKEQLKRLNIKYTSPANLSVITAWGQTMEHNIKDQDIIIIDHSIKRFTGDGVYLITWSDHLLIKRLQLAGLKKIELISDNAPRQTRIVGADQITIHAKALLVWNTKKL